MTEAQTLERKLDVRNGALADIFPLFDASTIQHAHQIMTARRADASLRNRWFWTADFQMYRVENGEEINYFAPREHNLGFRDIQNFTSQLLETNNYVPSKEGIDEVVNAVKAGSVLRTKLSDLSLQGNDNEWGYFEIDTGNVDLLNAAQMAFAKRAYGQGNEFTQNMRMLQEVEITKARVYALKPNYVEKQLKGKEDSAIARASRLGGFVGDSWFSAYDRVVDGAVSGLLGVLREGAEGAAAQKLEGSHAVQTIQQAQMPYADALKLVEQQYAPRSSPLFPVFEGMLNKIYRIKQ